jgi:hypothetical protein
MTSRYTSYIPTGHTSSTGYVPRYTVSKPSTAYVGFTDGSTDKTWELSTDKSDVETYVNAPELSDSIRVDRLASGSVVASIQPKYEKTTIESLPDAAARQAFILQKITNSVLMRVQGSFVPVHVVGVGYNTKGGKECQKVIHRALYMLYGTDYAFRDFDVDACFGFLENFEYSVIVEGTRFLDGQKPLVRIYICTESDDLRIELARRKDAWDKVFNISIIKKCKEECKDVTTELRSKSNYCNFLNTLVMPTIAEDVGMIARDIYQECNKNSISGGNNQFYVLDGCQTINICSPTPTEFALLTFNLNTEFYYLTCEEYLVHFTCWLATAIKKTTTAELTYGDVNKDWRITRFTKPSTPHTTGITITSPPLLIDIKEELYKTKVSEAVTILKHMFNAILDDHKKDPSCCGITTWIQKEILDHFECLEKYMSEKKSWSAPCIALLRSRFLVEVNRVIQFHVQIEESIKQQANSMSLVGKAAALVSNIYCKMSSRVVPWLLRISRIIEADYNGILLVKGAKELNECVNKLAVPNKFVELQRARLRIVEKVPHAFVDKEGNNSSEPSLNVLLKYIEQNQGNSNGLVVQEYLHLYQAMDTERKMKEYNLITEEVTASAGQVSELIRGAVEKGLLGPGQADQYLLLFRAMLTEFSHTLGQSDGRLLKGMLDAIRKGHVERMESDIEGLKYADKLKKIFARNIENAGPNALLAYIMKNSKNTPGLLTGLGTLMAISKEQKGLDSKTKGELLCMATSKHCTRDLTENVLTGMARIADSLKTPDGTAGRNASLDLLNNNIIFGTDGHAYVASTGPFGHGHVDLGKLIEL